MCKTLCLGFALLWSLVGCANYQEFYRPYRLVHPGTGAQVNCGLWAWWECELWDYTRRGYVRVTEPAPTQTVSQTP